MVRELEDLLVLDVRDREEYEAGHIEGSLQISRGTLEFYIDDAVPDRLRPMLVISRTGSRFGSERALRTSMPYSSRS